MKHNIQAKVQLVKLIDPNNTPVTQDFERWANATLALAETKPKHINPILEVVISDTATSAHLNKTYRQKPGPTNVLSFPFDEIPYEHGYLLGELVLCAEVIINEAKNQHKTLISHYAHLTIHGILHLLGYDHINPNDADLMESLEIEAMQQLGYDNPYKDRDTDD